MVKEMEMKTLAVGRTMTWANMAGRYNQLFLNIMVNITEQMVDAEPQVIITNDNLNCTVDAQIYFKVKSVEENQKLAIQR